MDKYEYNLKLDQMKALVLEGKYAEAAEIADTINWNKIKNVNALVKAGEIYEKVERFEDSREILLNAYDRSPIGRTIIYRLAEVAIKMKDFDGAKEYYDEFVDIAPHDNQRYVLQYNIKKAQGAPNKELISVLEEFKEQEYMEEWAFELAYLYHKTGLIDKCIDACDELILWFGDGPYVERALELKMLYQPLTKTQEEKYRRFRHEKDGKTVIGAEEMERAGEYGHDMVAIPQVTLNPSRFNTTNLQEEIAKGMQQIMEATEKDTVVGTMDSIKKIVEEIPYLQIPREEETVVKESAPHIETDEEIDGSLRINFQELLGEDSDGQISLMTDEKAKLEQQITGQMSIAEVLEEWEKTKRAAETALQVAEQKKLESAKARALQEAEDIMVRLNDVIPRIEAGTTPKELLEQEYLQVQPSEELPKFEIPELRTVPFMDVVVKEEVPVMEVPVEEEVPVTEVLAEKEVPVTEVLVEEEVPVMEVLVEEEVPVTEVLAEEEIPVVEDILVDASDLDIKTEEASHLFENINSLLDKEIARLSAGKELPLEEELLQEELPKEEILKEDIKKQEIPQATKRMPDLSKEIVINNLDEEDESEEILQKEKPKVVAEKPLLHLTEEQKAIFSYFVPVKGMEDQLCKALTGILANQKGLRKGSVGNLIIQGCQGSGKTVLATSIIKVLQKECGHPNGRIGKIDAETLNRKDAGQLIKKVAGGCLIIERAGSMNRETAVTLSLLLEQDESGTLVILEDTAAGIKKAMMVDDGFARKFTETVTVPIFTNDELVTFARAYANELGYEIDEMAVLALHNRISTIEKLDQATTIAEVKEIIDEAIEREAKSGLRKAIGILTAKRYTDDEKIVLTEKDFE